MLQAAWNPAGGVRYHLRARRHRLQLWAAFRRAVDQWFESWRPEVRTLVLVGPSGGYCLPLSLVARFERLICFEPDPIARWVFARRLQALSGSRTITWVTRDAWIEPILRGRPAPIAAGTGDTAILFSNFIGQLTFLVEEPLWPEFLRNWQGQVWPLLEAMPWASFHDRLSGPIAPAIARLRTPGERLGESQLLQLYEAHRGGELLDHLTADLLPPGEHYGYFHWPLIPDQHHLIEAVVGY